tara:strand:+ start:11808 stop:12302 length:495 start_codon:yes stop_codon:yes gene_type:complete
MARRSRIKGDFKLRGVLRRIAQLDQSDLPVSMAQAADLVLATQQALMPRDTGAAAQALEVRISKNGLDARVGIIGKQNNRDFYYVKFLEYGTKGYSGSQRAGGRKRRKTNKSNGANFFGYFPDIPARPAHPWLRPSIDTNRDDIRVIIREAIARTLARAAKGAQ